MPGAKKEQVTKESETRFRIKVREPALRNLANERVRQLLCDEFGVNKGAVRLVSGHRSPQKIFSIALSA